MKTLKRIIALAACLVGLHAAALITTNLVPPTTIVTTTTNGVSYTAMTFNFASPQLIFSYGNVTNTGGTNSLAAIMTVTVSTNAVILHPLSTNAESDTYIAGQLPNTQVTVTVATQITNAPSTTVTNVQLQLQQ